MTQAMSMGIVYICYFKTFKVKKNTILRKSKYFKFTVDLQSFVHNFLSITGLNLRIGLKIHHN